MQKSEPKPLSRRTPTGGRRMATMILQISLQMISACVSMSHKTGPTRATGMDMGRGMRRV